ncbi:hypothetical protein ACTFIZ_001574 [Dictyostelium cf. discoideum]
MQAISNCYCLWTLLILGQTRSQFYSALTNHLTILRYQILQKPNHQKEHTQLFVTDETYSFHLKENLSWWPIFEKRMHIHFIITEKSIYPLHTKNNNDDVFE